MALRVSRKEGNLHWGRARGFGRGKGQGKETKFRDPNDVQSKHVAVMGVCFGVRHVEERLLIRGRGQNLFTEPNGWITSILGNPTGGVGAVRVYFTAHGEKPKRRP